MRKCLACFKDYDEQFCICPHCGQIEIKKTVEPIHLEPGTILAGRYLLGQSIGAGGFGIVYRAWDMKLETVVAVKEFFASRLMTRAVGEKEIIVSKKGKEEFVYRKERFLAEARNMAKFGNHRSIPNVFEFFEENATAYIVMELLNGQELSTYIRENVGTVDIDFAILIANEIGKALCSLHDSGIIHRDVAPDNIFICSEKEIRLKLMDLGAAKLADETDEVIDIILKPGYSPPEQYDNSKGIGPWTDVYALGATLYMMLTGVKPDESTNRKIEDELVPPNQLNPAISENLSNTIMKAMAIEKHMRFKNVQDFLKAINGEKKVITLAKEKKRRNLRRGIGIAIAGVILLLSTSLVIKTYDEKKAAESLEKADISIWFSVVDGSTEENAIKYIIDDFVATFTDVTIEYRAIPESEYADELKKAAQNDELPTLFESTSADLEILEKAKDLDNLIASEQFKNAMFLDQYNNYYLTQKQMPLAIEVPIAFVITNGAECIEYTDMYFKKLSDFNYDNIAVDTRYEELAKVNYRLDTWSADNDEFFDNESNTSAVLLSSTMIINEFRTTLTNYEKKYVYPDLEEIVCQYTYEWSIGSGTENEIKAAEKMLTWMLGNVYQSALMVNRCNDGQIPVNKLCFETKIENKNLSPIKTIYNKFVFKRGE